jgi:SanA protein
MRQRLACGMFLALVACTLAILVAHEYVQRRTEGRVSGEATSIPEARVGLVLGCAKTLSNGSGNLFFLHRMSAAADLYHAGKVQYLLVSGANPTHEYDEATDMMNALIRLGVPAERITRDYAGFRTFDSMVRAQKVFGLESCVVISQEFHVKRAICIADHIGLECHGYSAADVTLAHSFRTLARERLARVKLLLDLYLLPTKPKFLGEPITIG